MMILRVSAVAALGAHTAFGMRNAEEEDELTRVLREIREQFPHLEINGGSSTKPSFDVATPSTKPTTYADPKPKTSLSDSCTCPNCVPKPAPKHATPAHTLTPDASSTAIFFDFDDTLVPTKFLVQNRVHIQESYMTMAELQGLRDVAEVAAKVLTEAKSLGHVCMVTAGGRAWIQSALNQSWAKPLKEALTNVEKKTTRGKDWNNWIEANGDDAYKFSKKEQMETFLAERSLEMTNLISVGDSTDEIDAIKDIGEERGVVARSIKLEYGQPFGPVAKIRTVADQLEKVLKQLRLLRNGQMSLNHLVYSIY